MCGIWSASGIIQKTPPRVWVKVSYVIGAYTKVPERINARAQRSFIPRCGMVYIFFSGGKNSTYFYACPIFFIHLTVARWCGRNPIYKYESTDKINLDDRLSPISSVVCFCRQPERWFFLGFGASQWHLRWCIGQHRELIGRGASFFSCLLIGASIKCDWRLVRNDQWPSRHFHSNCETLKFLGH